jgi:prepilin-type N-terminal cleavage/methylation domain-containing protein/prepilin-type processing-associated H-X9-DG protein
MRGWTLLELLIGVAILGILTAVFIPVASSARAKAQAAKCLVHLRALGSGFNLYLGEHQLIMPRLAAARASRTEDLPVIDTLLAPYVDDTRVFACPADSSLARDTGTSYFYNSVLGGQSAANLDFLSLTTQASRIPVLLDKEAWHPGKGVQHLFADGHVGNALQWSTTE